VCWSNLVSVAGEWTSFDPDWLECKIMARFHSRRRLLHAVNLGRITVSLSQGWQATKSLVLQLRGQHANSAA